MYRKPALVTAMGMLLIFIARLAQAQGLDQQLLAKENEVWATSIGTHANLEAFKTYLAPGYLQIDATGVVSNIQESLKAFKTCQLSSFRIDQPSVIRLSRTVASVVYRVNVSGTCGGQQVPPFIESADTWVKNGDRWVIQIHTEAAITGPH